MLGKIAVVMSFCSMLEITGIVDAAGVKASVERAVESSLGEKMAVFNKTFGTIATDGAAVMTGCKAGVVALMKVTQPSLVSIHCFSHHLELACCDVVKTNPSYQEIDKFLLDIYLFYHNRYVWNAALIVFCKILR